MNIVVFHHQNRERDISRGGDEESHNYSNADMLAVQRVIFLIAYISSIPYLVGDITGILENSKTDIDSGKKAYRLQFNIIYVVNLLITLGTRFCSLIPC